MMDSTTLIGLVAAFCTTSAFIPQVIHVLRRGNTDGISLQMYTIFTIGVALWLVYGIILEDVPMLLANLVTFVLASVVLYLTLRQRLRDKKQPHTSMSNSSETATQNSETKNKETRNKETSDRR